MKVVATIALLLASSLAHAQPLDDDCTDADCQIDLTVDECAAPGAGCLSEQDLDDATLERLELTPLPTALASAFAIANANANADAHADADVSSGVSGGCTTTDGALPSTLALSLLAFVLLRRRRAIPLFLLTILLGCVAGGDAGWDSALADGPSLSSANQYLDVLTAAEPSADPTAAFSLSRHHLDNSRALRRVSDATCGDRFVVSDLAADGALLGYAAAQPQPGTAALTELVAPDGCGAIYETDPEAIALYVADGFAPGAVLGWVWPPGWGDPAPVDDDGTTVATDAVTACNLGAHPALFLFYTGIDHASDFGLLRGCPGEVVLGEKHMDRPHGEFAAATAHAAGGRTALVFGANGQQFRDLLLRSNGVERTAAFIRARLKAGYDYIVVDEVTTDASWRDGSTVNRRFRQLLLRIPPRTLIPYISLDLTMYPGGGQAMRDRRLLLRAFSLRARMLALEDYLHTDAVIGGAAPPTFRTAANRLVAAVHGLRGAAGISTRTLTTLGLSMHTRYPQYNYLDDTRHDLSSIARQATAIRHGSARLHAERGLGFYFIGKSDITPSRGYHVEDVVAAIHKAMLRFR